MLQRMKRLLTAVTFAGVPVVALMVPSVAHAAVKTYIGGGGNSLWSNATNWSGGAIPANGDSVVIDNAAAAATGGYTHMDIAGLSLAGITFTNNNTAGAGATLDLEQDLTLSGAISQDVTDTQSVVSIGSPSGTHVITLGGDTTITATAGIDFTTPGDSFALASHALTITTPANALTFKDSITGSGSVTFNSTGSMTTLDLTSVASNSYSGSTTLSGPMFVTASPAYFGTSAITVGTGSRLTFWGTSSNITINNTVTVTGEAGNTPTKEALSFGGSGPVTYVVPNIVLNGSSIFQAASGDTVNLAGITANGFCLGYTGTNSNASDGPGNGFQNGPTGCNITLTTQMGADPATPAATPAPKTPNTGFSIVTANPVQILVVALFGAAAIAGVAYKLRAVRR